MEPIAQTNLQLYNQLRRQRRSVNELSGVRRAYELASTLYSGYYQADRKPFIAHSVGVGSVLAHLDLPAELIATGLLHNVYGNGDFGDGRKGAATRDRRRRVRNSVGERIEGLVYRFRQVRIKPDAGDDFADRIARLDDSDRQLVLVDLADYLEKCVDCGVLYFGDGRWVTETLARHGGRLIDIAGELGQPRLAEMLAEAFAQVAAEPGIPQVLRGPSNRKYLSLVVPRSCRRRWYPIVSNLVRQAARPANWSAGLHRLVKRSAGMARRRIL